MQRAALVDSPRGGVAWPGRAAWVRAAHWLSALGVYGAGTWARFEYAIHGHTLRHFVTSDALEQTILAGKLATGAAQLPFDTVWPPGTAALLALSSRFEPSLGGAAWLWFVLASLTPLLIAHVAWITADRRAAWWSLALASLSFGFIHSTGFALSETPFATAVSLALWFTVVACTRRASSVARWSLGFLAGAAWGLAAAFRPNAIPVAFVIAACLALHFTWRRQRSRVRFLAIALVGWFLVVAPLAHRSVSLLGGRFALTSSNAAMNVALGHAGKVGGLDFHGAPGDPVGGSGTWYPPGLLGHGYHGTADVPASMYDTRGILAWVWQRARDEPGHFALVSLGNALDLFNGDIWPSELGRLDERTATVARQLWLWCVLGPGLVAWFRTLRRLRHESSDLDVLLVAGPLALFVTAAFTLGEARYRWPFDAFFILLAARLFAGTEPTAPTPTPSRALDRVAYALGAALIVTALGIAAIAHPRVLALSRWLPATAAPRPLVRAAARVDARDAARAPTSGASWNEKGTQVITCGTGCAALHVVLDTPSRARHLRVSADRADRYEATFARNGAPLATVAWGPFRGAKLLETTLDVPPAALAAGFDQVQIRPLFGDGRYSVGRVLLAD